MRRPRPGFRSESPAVRALEKLLQNRLPPLTKMTCPAQLRDLLRLGEPIGGAMALGPAVAKALPVAGVAVETVCEVRMAFEVLHDLGAADAADLVELLPLLRR